MRHPLGLSLLCFLCLVVSMGANANLAKTKKDANPAIPEVNGVEADRGYWFYKDKEKEKNEEEVVIPPPPKEAKKEDKAEAKKDPCKDLETWTPECGFVDPGSNWDFQVKQRDALFQSYSMTPENSKTVEALQYYLKWVFGKASVAARMMAYNRVQNPDLDPTLLAPTSSFGLTLAREVKGQRSKEFFDFLKKEGAFLVYFSRDDCKYCHAMMGALKRVKRDTGLELWNAALDDRCIIKDADKCMTAPETTLPAAALKVKTVPALFVYVPDNNWIRVANGLSSGRRITARIESFLRGFKEAVIKGMTIDPEGNGFENGRVPVSFSGAGGDPMNGSGFQKGVGDIPDGVTLDDIQGVFGGGS